MQRKTHTKPRTRRRPSKTRRRRMRGGMTKEEILALLGKEIGSLFPEMDSSQIEIRAIRHDTAAYIMMKHCKEREAHHEGYYPMIMIDFSKNMMEIGLLTSCSPLTGRELVMRFVSLAKRLGLSYIKLDDASELYVHPSTYGRKACRLSLAHTRILLKGESWYQSLGFVSNQDMDDREHNERTRAMPLHDFVASIVSRERNPPTNAERLLATLLEVFPELRTDMPVSDAIQKMMVVVNQIGETVCESREFALLKRLIDDCELEGGEDHQPLLQHAYERILTLNA